MHTFCFVQLPESDLWDMHTFLPEVVWCSANPVLQPSGSRSLCMCIREGWGTGFAENLYLAKASANGCLIKSIETGIRKAGVQDLRKTMHLRQKSMHIPGI